MPARPGAPVHHGPRRVPSRVCSQCRQAVDRTGYSNNQWRRNPAVSRCQDCVSRAERVDAVADDDDVLVSPRDEQRRDRKHKWTRSSCGRFRVCIGPLDAGCSVVVELVDPQRASTRPKPAGQWRLPSVLDAPSHKAHCLGIRSVATCADRLLAVDLVNRSTRSAVCGVVVVVVTTSSASRYVFCGLGMFRPRFDMDRFCLCAYDDVGRDVRIPLSRWGFPDPGRARPEHDAGPHDPPLGALSRLPHDVLVVVARFLDLDDLRSVQRARLHSVVRSRVALRSPALSLFGTIDDVPRSAVFSTCGRLVVYRSDSRSLTMLRTDLRLEPRVIVARNCLDPLPAHRYVVVHGGTSVSPDGTQVAVAVETYAGDPNGGASATAFDANGNQVWPEPAGVVVVRLADGSHRYHPGPFRAACYSVNGRRLSVLSDNALYELEPDGSPVKRLDLPGPSNGLRYGGTYQVVATPDGGLVRLAGVGSIYDLDVEVRVAVCRADDPPALLDAAQFASLQWRNVAVVRDPGDPSVDNPLAIARDGRFMYSIRKTLSPSTFELVAYRCDGSALYTVAYEARSRTSDWILAASPDGIRLAVLTLRQQITFDYDSDRDFDSDESDDFLEEPLSMESPVTIRVEIWDLVHGCRQSLAKIRTLGSPREVRWLCNCQILIQDATTSCSIYRIDCWCPCVHCASAADL